MGFALESIRIEDWEHPNPQSGDVSGKMKSMTDEKVEAHFKLLQRSAYLFWSDEIVVPTATEGLLRDLKETKGVFIRILSESTPENIVSNLMSPEKYDDRLPPNQLRGLIVKHCMLFTDIGMELIKRAKKYVSDKGITHFHIRDGKRVTEYRIKSLHEMGVTNPIIYVGRDRDLLEDILVLLCYGSQIEEIDEFLSYKRCKIAKMAGKVDEIANHLNNLYLSVNRQIGGARAVDAGNAPLAIVVKAIENYFKELGKSDEIEFVSGGRIPGLRTQSAKVDTQFDLVIKISCESSKSKYMAVEVAFQETTNSTIERKGGQALGRFEAVKDYGAYIGYVIDGIGCFERATGFVKKCIKYSDIVVTLKPNMLKALCDFINNVQENG